MASSVGSSLRWEGHFCIDGARRLAFAVSVGNNEDSSPEVRRSDVGGRKQVGTGSVFELAEVPAHRWQPGPHAACDVFDDDDRRTHLGDDAGEVVPERGALPLETASSACAGDVLAGEPSADEIHMGIVPGLRDIGEPRDVRPVLREHGPTERIDLDLPDDLAHAGALKAELQTTDAGEERTDGHHGFALSLRGRAASLSAASMARWSARL